jgi:hypothetical protein
MTTLTLLDYAYRRELRPDPIDERSRRTTRLGISQLSLLLNEVP